MKQKLFALFVGILLLAFQTKTKAIVLSPDAEVSILTCGPTDDVYAIYGHTAIRVKDPRRMLDVIFNYGVFSFNAPHFIYRFAKGETDYMLAAEKYSNFIEQYKHEKRSVDEQVLNLKFSEKQQLLNFLMNNARPENREYRYNFFFDNCATRVRDVIEKQVDGTVVFSEDAGTKETFRQHVSFYQKVLPWTNFGIQLVLGEPADEVTTSWQEMFLPDLLEKHLGEAKIKRGSETVPLVKLSRNIFDPGEKPVSGFDPFSPFMVLLVLLVLVISISLFQWKKKKINYWPDYLLLFMTGIGGLLILWLVMYSQHPAMRPNYNLWWAVPANLFFLFAWMVKKWRPFLKWYWKALAVWMVLFFLFNLLIPQVFPIGVYLIALMMLSRALLHVIWFMRLKRQVEFVITC